MYKDDSEALLWIEGAWPNPGNLSWLQGSWVAERPPPTPVVTIPPAAERNWARLADRYYFAVLACGLIGIPLWFSVKDKKRLLLILTVVLWTALHLVFIPNSRYHVSLVPIFCLWAATSLVFAFDMREAAADEGAEGEPDAMKRSLLRLLLSREIALLCLALAIAFALRLGWMLAVDPQPTEFRVGDPYFYDLFGRSLAAGKGYLNMWGAPTAQWPPGYPLVLAALYKVFGHSIALAKLLNVALGTATCLLAYLIGKRVFSGAVGLTAAFALAVFPSQVFWPTLLLSETLATFLVALIAYIVLVDPWLALLEDGNRLGALIGFTSLVRGETVLLAVPLAIVWAVAHRSWRTGLRYGGLTLVATGLVILPWVVRNWVVMDYPILISTGSAENLIGGHWPGADGLGSFVPIIEVTETVQEPSLRPGGDGELQGGDAPRHRLHGAQPGQGGAAGREEAARFLQHRRPADPLDAEGHAERPRLQRQHGRTAGGAGEHATIASSSCWRRWACRCGSRCATRASCCSCCCCSTTRSSSASSSSASRDCTRR